MTRKPLENKSKGKGKRKREIKCTFVKDENMDIRIMERFFKDLYLALLEEGLI